MVTNEKSRRQVQMRSAFAISKVDCEASFPVEAVALSSVHRMISLI
jgi:hypothetical protein